MAVGLVDQAKPVISYWRITPNLTFFEPPKKQFPSILKCHFLLIVDPLSFQIKHCHLISSVSVPKTLIITSSPVSLFYKQTSRTGLYTKSGSNSEELLYAPK